MLSVLESRLLVARAHAIRAACLLPIHLDRLPVARYAHGDRAGARPASWAGTRPCLPRVGLSLPAATRTCARAPALSRVQRHRAQRPRRSRHGAYLPIPPPVVVAVARCAHCRAARPDRPWKARTLDRQGQCPDGRRYQREPQRQRQQHRASIGDRLAKHDALRPRAPFDQACRQCDRADRPAAPLGSDEQPVDQRLQGPFKRWPRVRSPSLIDSSKSQPQARLLRWGPVPSWAGVRAPIRSQRSQEERGARPQRTGRQKIVWSTPGQCRHP